MNKTVAVVLALLVMTLGASAQNARKGGLTGWDYFKQKQYDVALELLEKDHRFYPQSHEILDGIGWCRYFLGDLDGAESAFKQALAIDAEYRFSKMGVDAVAQARNGPVARAESLLEQGQYADAIAQFRALEDRELGADVELRLHRGLGWACYYLGDYQEALKEFQKAIRIKRDDARSSAGIGYVQLARKKYSQADIAFEAALAADPDLVLVRLDYAWSAYLAGNTTAALRRFQAARDRDATSWGAVYGLGWTYDKKGEEDKAIATFREALALSSSAATSELLAWIEKDRARSTLMLDYGFALIEAGKPKDALNVFLRAKGVGDRTLHLLGEAMARLNDGDNLGAQRLAQAMADHGDDPRREIRCDSVGNQVTVSASSVLGWSSLRLGDLDEARAAFSRAIEGQGIWADGWTGLGWVELAGKHHLEAESRFQHALDILPGYPGALAGLAKVREWRYADYDRAWTLMESGEYGAADEIFDQLRNDQSGRFPAARRDLLDYSQAEVQRRQGSYNAAVALYRRALEVSPDLSEAWVGLGWSLVLLKEWELALTELQKAMGQRLDDPLPRRLAAWAMIQSGQIDEALECLAVWTNSFPGDAELAERYGRLLIDKLRLVEARIAFQSAVAADVDRIPLADLDRFIAAYDEMKPLEGSLGWALHLRGRNNEAIARFEKAIALEPGEKSHLKGLALASSAAGRHREAAAQAELWFATLDKSNSARAERRALEMTLGWDLYAAGEAKLALDRFREVEKRDGDPGGVDMFNALGWTWLKMDKALKAREYFLKALAQSPRLESALQGLETVNEVLSR